MTTSKGIRYEVRTLGTPPGPWALSRHRSFQTAGRSCVWFIEQGRDAHVYVVATGRRVARSFARTPEGVECFIFSGPETDEVYTALYRGRRRP